MDKYIDGFEGLFTVSPEGIVWNVKKNREVPQQITPQGYLYVSLYKEGKVYHRRVNRLVAMAYIPNPENKPEVDHKNQNRLDNHWTNLAWATSAENKANARIRGRKIQRTPIRCVETGEVFKSMVQAAEWAGIHRQGINLCVLGQQKTAGGYHWERVYKNKEGRK